MEYQIQRSDFGPDKLHEVLNDKKAELDLLSTYAGEGKATDSTIAKLKLQ